MQTRLKDKCRAHIELAQRLVNDPGRILLIMHGFSGSGKTVLSQIALEVLGAMRVRSDVERKRLYGLAASVRTRSEVGEGIYAASAGEATYDHLATLAEHVIAAGFPVLVDASFLKRHQRKQFQALAAKHKLPFVILDVQAAEPTLRRRIASRAAVGTDASEASEAVLDHQLATAEELTSEEQAWSRSFDGECLTSENVTRQLLAIAS